MSDLIIIDDQNFTQHMTPPPHDDGTPRAKGLKPRNFTTHPVGCFAFAKPFPDELLIPRSEWRDRLNELKKNNARLIDIRNRGDFGKPIPARDQDGKGYCLPAGTLIRLEDGSQKPIEKMTLLDRVLTAEGNVGRVLQLHVRDYIGELVTIKSYGHGHLRMTPNHQVLTKRGYAAAGDLTAQDYIRVPRYAPAACSVLQTSQHVRGVRRRVKSIAGKPAWETRQPNSWDRDVVHVPDLMELTPAIGRIFGLWLVEGFFDGSVVTWSFSAAETDTLVRELVELIHSEWGLEATIKPGPGPNVTLVEIQGVQWRQLFESVLGKGAGGKRLHADVAGGPPAFLESMFWGWMDGDGCARGRRDKAYLCGATVSHSLAISMYDIANSIGLTPAINKEQAQVNEYAKIRRDVWKVQVNPYPSDYRQNYRLQSEDACVWRKVYRIDRAAFRGAVYNIGVEGDNSYVAEGIGVHNCWAHSSVSAMLLVRALMNEPYVDLSAFAVACTIKKFRDEGGFGAQSLQFIADRGVPTSEFWPQQSMDHALVNKPGLWENAALHKFDDWFDLEPRNLDQYVSCGLRNFPTVNDYNWWGHSVGGMGLESLGSGTGNPTLADLIGWILNSWGNGWSANGAGQLKAGKCLPDACLAACVASSSMT